jgi:hypothetical protein
MNASEITGYVSVIPIVLAIDGGMGVRILKMS